MLVPMNTSHGEAKLHEAFIASMMVKSWKLLFYPILSSDSGYLETSEPGELLRKMWLAEHTRTKTTLPGVKFSIIKYFTVTKHRAGSCSSRAAKYYSSNATNGHRAATCVSN